MSFLLKWLGLSVERAPGIAVRPVRYIEIELPYEDAFDRCRRGLEEAVGAQVRDADAQRGTLEATFGLMFSERIACSVRTLDDRTTAVTIESRRIAGAELPKDSAVLDRLEGWIREGR